MVVVRTVVGNVQLAVAIDKRQVTIAVQTADVTRTKGDEVAVIDIVDRGGGVTIYGSGIGTQTGSPDDVSTGKDGIMDNDATLLLGCAYIHFIPTGRPCVSSLLT